MALVRLPLGEQRSGRIGGTVYSHNRGGPYIRTAAIPTNPNTTRQSNIRAIMSSLSNAWYATLTQAQRDMWDQYAGLVPVVNRLGMSTYISGQNQYVRCNTPRIQAGIARVDDAPTVTYNAETPVALTATASEATQELTVSWLGFHYWASQDGGAMLVSLGAPQLGSRKFFRSPYRYAGAFEGDSVTPITSPQVISTLPWLIAEGQRLWVKARITEEDGRLGEFAVYNFLCAA